MSKGRERFDIDPVPTAISELFSGEFVEPELATDVLTHAPGVNRNNTNVTILDLFQLPDATDEYIIALIERHTGLSLSNAVQLPKTIERINNALERAKSYLVHYLGLEALPSSLDIVRVQSKKDVIEILRKTASFQREDRKTLVPHAGYCALVLAAFGALELEKKDIRQLDALTRYVYQKLSDTQRDENPLFIPVQNPSMQPGTPVTVVVHDVRGTTSTLFMRGKNDFSLLTKILNDPTANAETALKDGIGFRLAFPGTPKREGVQTVSSVIKHLQLLGARITELKNTNLFTNHDMLHIEDDVRDVVDLEDVRIYKDSKNKGKSSGAIQQFRILGTIDIPVDGVEGSLTVPHPFEIQFFQKDDDGHNAGTAHHDVYDVVKKAQVMTRFFGACSEEWLIKQLLMCAPIQDKEQATVFLKKLVAEGRLVKLPSIKERKIVRYVMPAVYKRWCVSGLVSAELCRRVLK